DPGRAQFTDFTPFWEFVAGPINAGTFGPGDIDRTFGPDVKYSSAPPGMKQNRPPTDGVQYFGLAKIDGASEVLTVSLNDLTGKTLHKVDVKPAYREPHTTACSADEGSSKSGASSTAASRSRSPVRRTTSACANGSWSPGRYCPACGRSCATAIVSRPRSRSSSKT